MVGVHDDVKLVGELLPVGDELYLGIVWPGVAVSLKDLLDSHN